MELSAADRQQLAERGIPQEEIARQLDLHRAPPPPTRLVRACQLGDGIVRLEPDRRQELARTYRRAADSGRFGKFVPASGAATRMFRDLLAARAGDDDEAADRFFSNLHRFAFRNHLASTLGVDPEALERLARRDPAKVLAALLDDTPDETALGFASIPKGLVPFHRSDGEGRTAAEEHLRESAELATDSRGRCRVHFTVPLDRETSFRQALDGLSERVGGELGVQFLIGTSTQSPATDTVAADLEGQPFRDADGGLVFRPGGHGALIGNLGALDIDLVFIKNIDNILPLERRPRVVHWKQVLGGLLLELDERIAEILRRCESEENDPQWLDSALDFAQRQLGLAEADAQREAAAADQRAFLQTWLDRPLRICGVVPNTGEPGGGPFWVEDAWGRLGRQIVEPAQVDLRDPAQADLFLGSTHFNPVDVVCRLRSHRGKPYDLEAYVDPNTAFVTRKTLDGRPLQALERPGLWNGSMAGWNTLFVEVPGETFAPVKTVFDLLRPEHQPSEDLG